MIDPITRKYLLRIHRLLYPHQKQLLRVALGFYLVALAIVVLLRHLGWFVTAGFVTAFALASLIGSAAWLAAPAPPIDEVKE